VNALASLRQASDAVSELGLEEDAAAAAKLLNRVEERLGFEGTAFVLAIAGGTGVGKSSLLNALAAAKVSDVGVIRPTTFQPLAWVSESELSSVRPLLDWVGIGEVVTHHRDDLKGIVVIDLPDFDSVAVDHRATVDRMLPRIDAMLWVVDPEKYDDELLHSYLRELSPHADRIGFVFNKADRLEPAEQRQIETDFVARLGRAGFKRPVVFMLSARTGEGLDALLKSLQQRATEKELVRRKLETDIDRQLQALATAAGVGINVTPLIDPESRTSAMAEAVSGALAVIDPDGVARQVKAAALYRARRQGGSLLARALALLSNLTGTRRRSADPEGFLQAWRQRGSLGHVLNPIRRVTVSGISRLPGPARSAVMKRIEFDQLDQRVTRAIDGAVRSSRADLAIPRSWLWWVIGGLQLVLGAAFLFAVAWYLTLIFGPGSLPVATVDLPYLGAVPVPLALLVGSLVISFVLGLVLNLHASWLGRRRGRKVAAAVRGAVEGVIEEAALGPFDQVERARSRIRAALNP
jgi:GTP-binding protein EngB required for normal cell division